MTRSTNPSIHPLARRERWKAGEIVFWVAIAAVYFVFPKSLVLATQILIAGLFALSLDLILGYAGIVTLGHAAFFGVGAYAAGLLGPVWLDRTRVGPPRLRAGGRLRGLAVGPFSCCAAAISRA